jgi:2-(1,2-epoxy-1,2-dihydrophenyl)acetyl-CoA isomerase
MTEPVLLIDDNGGVRTLTLNRPEMRNALNEELLIELRAGLDAAAADPAVRCIILTGAGSAFCAGADLTEFQARINGQEEPSFGDNFTPIVRLLRAIEKPIIGAINGPAVGAGCSFAIACDLRIASDRGSLSMAYVRVGLIPDTGGSLVLPLLVGLARASELAFTGGRVDAAEALRIGLVNRVVPAAELTAAALTWAQELAGLPTTAIGLTKRAFNHAMMPTFDEHLEYELELIAQAFDTHDHREGVAAFLERRPPVFTGR